MVRKLICCLLVVAFPVSLMAADSGTAMLHSNGKTWVNGAPAPASSAVFNGDLVQTESTSAANLVSTGSSVAVFPSSLVKLDGKQVGLQHGTVTVATAKRFATRAGDVVVAPASDAWTEFQVSENDGKVQIVARKGDLNVTDGSGTTTVSSGQQTTRNAFNDQRKGGGAAPAGGGGLLDSPIFVAIGGAAVGALVTWAILQDGKPFSPSQP